MITRLQPPPFLVLAGVALLATVQVVALSQSGRSQPQSERVRSGVTHFERAFYDHVPHAREVEAAREFDLAIAEFEREVTAQPASVVAHEYLGRIYALRKQPAKAGAHYDRVMALEPLNVEACVLAALAYVDAGQPDEARARLAAAQSRTTDPVALAKLAEYRARLDAVHP
jgi:predicted Zn-dependent protease